MSTICYEEEYIMERKVDQKMQYDFAFENINTSDEKGKQIKKIPRLIAKEKLLYLEMKLWSELKHLYLGLCKKNTT